MTSLSPSTTTAHTAQPAGTAIKLALKDQARTLRYNLAQGAHWLLEDVGAGLARQVEPRNAPAALHSLQHLLGSTAQATLSTLQAAQHVAAATVLPDADYRTLHFNLHPLADYFNTAHSKPSRLFTDAFYWLIRHELQANAAHDARLLARQQAVDEAWWLVRDKHPALLARLQPLAASAGAAARDDVHVVPAEDHALLCAALLQALLATQPVRDASLPPWAERKVADSQASEVLPALLTTLVCVGLVRAYEAASADVADRLQLARELVTARLPAFEAALKKHNANEALAAEFAFTFRHA